MTTNQKLKRGQVIVRDLPVPYTPASMIAGLAHSLPQSCNLILSKVLLIVSYPPEIERGCRFNLLARYQEDIAKKRRAPVSTYSVKISSPYSFYNQGTGSGKAYTLLQKSMLRY